MKGEQLKATVDKEVVSEVLRLMINEVKKAEREKVLREANLILAKYGKRLSYLPSVMEMKLDGKWGKGEIKNV